MSSIVAGVERHASQPALLSRGFGGQHAFAEPSFVGRWSLGRHRGRAWDGRRRSRGQDRPASAGDTRLVRPRPGARTVPRTPSSSSLELADRPRWLPERARRTSSPGVSAPRARQQRGIVSLNRPSQVPDSDVLLTGLGLEAAHQLVVDRPVVVQPAGTGPLKCLREEEQVDGERERDVLAEARGTAGRRAGPGRSRPPTWRRGRGASRTGPLHRSIARGSRRRSGCCRSARCPGLLAARGVRNRPRNVSQSKGVVHGSRRARCRGTATTPRRRGRTAASIGEHAHAPTPGCSRP